MALRLYFSMLTLTVSFCVLSMPASGAEKEKPLWLAVGPSELIGRLGPLLTMRRSQGMETLVATGTVAQALASAPRPPDFLMLVGDDAPNISKRPWHLPSKKMPFYRWRSNQKKQFTSDSAWGDLDGDGNVDIPVGRIPVRTAKATDVVVRKIVAYEKKKPTIDDLRFIVWGGASGYNEMVDSMSSAAIMTTFQAVKPQHFRPWMMISYKKSPFCGWPADEPAMLNKQLRQGGLLATLMGHGTKDLFDPKVSADMSPVYYKASHARSAFAKGPPCPPLIVFACDTGNFAGTSPCIAERLLLMPGGPVAVIGSTTESHPLCNYYTATSLLAGLEKRHERIGSLWFHAQLEARKTFNPLWHALLKDIEGKLENEINVGKLRRDQILMYSLLGDPATKLRLPAPLKVSVKRTDTGWRWKVARPSAKGTRIHAGLRSLTPNIPAAKQNLDREQANKLLKTANAAYDFRPLKATATKKSWIGTVKSNGILRLVVIGPGIFRATTVRLERPAENSTNRTRVKQ